MGSRICGELDNSGVVDVCSNSSSLYRYWQISETTHKLEHSRGCRDHRALLPRFSSRALYGRCMSFSAGICIAMIIFHDVEYPTIFMHHHFALPRSPPTASVQALFRSSRGVQFVHVQTPIFLLTLGPCNLVPVPRRRCP